MQAEGKHGVLFELMQSGDEALDFLSENLAPDVADTCVLICETLRELYENIAAYIENNNIKERHKGREAALNATLAADKLKKLYSVGDFENAALLLTCELLPLHIFLTRELDVWFAIYPDMGKMRERCERELESVKEYRKQHKETLEMEYIYDVSIMVLCYNKVSLTKMALDSLLKYTNFDKYRVEIIVINNGSSDGGETSAFIGELDDPRIKTVNLKYPLGYNGYSLGPLAARGRYCVEFHTDVIATEKWLDNLIGCISSDSNIGAVAAACNNSSNNQAIPVSYADPLKNDEELQRFAKDYNQCDPLKWEDRARVVPTSGFVIPTILYRYLLRDPWLYYGQFTDDDMAMFLRRSGFRQVFAKDTFLHHFGSQTSAADMEKNDSVRHMKRRFCEKWNIDAWYGIFFNPGILNYMERRSIAGSESFLFIDPLFGSTPMYIFANYMQKGKKAGGASAIVRDLRYLADAGHYYDEVFSGGVTESLARIQSKFDYVIFHPDISEYVGEDFPEMLRTLHSVCKAGTKILFTLSNPGYCMRLFELANGVVSNESNEPWRGLRLIDPDYVYTTAEKQGFHCSTGSITGQQSKQQAQIMRNFQALAQDGTKAKNMAYMSLLFELCPK